MRTARILLSIALLLGAVYGNSDRADSAKPAPASARSRLIESVHRPGPRASFHVRDFDLNQGTSVPLRQPAGPVDAETSAATATPFAGMTVATSWLDMQHTHSLGKQIIRYSGHDYVLMVWSAFPNFDPSGAWDRQEVRFVSYRRSTATLFPGYGGHMISLDPISRGHYANIDATDESAMEASCHQREGFDIPSIPFVMFQTEPENMGFFDNNFYPEPPCAEALWPKLSTHHRAGGLDLIHMIARTGPTCGAEHLLYSRAESALWTPMGIIDSTPSRGYILVADQHSDKVAIIMHDDDEPQFNGANNIVYYESATTGLGWVNGSELGPTNRTTITNYTDTLNGPQAWRHIDAAYDNAGVLHIIWDEQPLANQTSDVTIRHWSQDGGVIRPVAAGIWPATGAQNRLNLTNLSLGIGDGSTVCATSPGGDNLNALYVMYTKFGGMTSAQRGDTSAAGYPNGELCLTMSVDGGTTWSTPVNLTNTASPDCNPAIPGNECRSEDWGSLSKVVSDLEIFYIGDHDAGAAVLGEGTYQPNDVMYLHFSGGTADALHLCPPLLTSPVFSASVTADYLCEYHAEPGAIKNDEYLTIVNTGSGDLSGEIAVLPGAPWLSVVGAGTYTVNAGDPEQTFQIVMDASTLTEGYYEGAIRVTHDDPDVPSPWDFPIRFYVITDFQCAPHVIMSTGVH